MPVTRSRAKNKAGTSVSSSESQAVPTAKPVTRAMAKKNEESRTRGQGESSNNEVVAESRNELPKRAGRKPRTSKLAKTKMADEIRMTQLKKFADLLNPENAWYKKATATIVDVGSAITKAKCRNKELLTKVQKLHNVGSENGSHNKESKKRRLSSSAEPERKFELEIPASFNFNEKAKSVAGPPMKKLQLGSSPVLSQPVQFVEDETKEPVKDDECVENVVDQQQEVIAIPSEADVQKPVDRTTITLARTPCVPNRDTYEIVKTKHSLGQSDPVVVTNDIQGSKEDTYVIAKAKRSSGPVAVTDDIQGSTQDTFDETSFFSTDETFVDANSTLADVIPCNQTQTYDSPSYVTANEDRSYQPTINETIACIGEVTNLQTIYAPILTDDDDSLEIEFVNLPGPSSGNLQSLAEDRKKLSEPVRDINESLFLAGELEAGAAAFSEISLGGSKPPDESHSSSSDETNNYEISQLDEILDDKLNHRLNKKIPMWARDGELLQGQLYLSNPLLLEHVRMLNSEQFALTEDEDEDYERSDQVAVLNEDISFPPCNIYYKLFPGAEPPFPRK